MENKKIKLILLFVIILMIVKTYSDKSKNMEIKEKNIFFEKVEKKPYAISSSNIVASKVGADVLDKGGNAVDAAVAMSYALSVLDPQSSGLGGGGAMLIYDDGDSVLYDYYMASGRNVNRNNIGIPGFIKGMETVNYDYGSLPLSDLIDYSINILERGVQLDNNYKKEIEKNNEVKKLIRENSYIKRNRIYYPELLDTLNRIKKGGSGVFYNGETNISRNFLEVSGIDKDSLNNYRVIKRNPLVNEYKDLKIITSPPPFSGISILQMLKMSELLDFDWLGTEEYYKNHFKILSVALEDRYNIIADNIENNYEYLTFDYLSERLEEKSEIKKIDEDGESTSTTGFTIIDSNGMAVACTNTISSHWGSYIVKDGIIYNNSLKNFSKKGINIYKKFSRPRTGISPTIITKDDYIEAISSSGGKNIPNNIYSNIIYTKSFNMTLQEANNYPRNEIRDGNLFLESKENIYSLEGKYTLDKRHSVWGMLHGVSINGKDADGQIDMRNYQRAGYISNK